MNSWSAGRWGFSRTFVMLFLLILVIAGATAFLLWRGNSNAGSVELPPDVQIPDFVGQRTAPAVVESPPVPEARVDVAAPPMPTPSVRTDLPPVQPSLGPVTSMSELLRKLSDIRGKGYTSQTQAQLVDLGRELAREDFENAVRLMKAVSDTAGRGALCQGIFEYQATVNPQAALADALKLNPGDEATGRFLANFSRDMRVFNTAVTAVLKGWAQGAPYEAAAYVSQLPESTRRDAAVAVYGVWGESDPAAALSMAASLPADTQRRVLPQIVGSWAVKNPQAAWGYVVALPEGTIDNPDNLLADIAARWAEADVDTALAWIGSSITDDRLYTELMKRATSQLAGRSPATAAAIVGAVPGLYELQPHVLTASMHAWVQSDPQAAAEWAKNVELESVRAMAIKTVSAFWAGKDFDKAYTWANSLRDTMSRAYALSNVALEQGRSTPEKSTDWIYRVSDEFERARAVAGYVLGRVSRAKDGEASRTLRNTIMSDTLDFNAIQDALLKSGLSDTEKQELIDMLP